MAIRVVLQARLSSSRLPAKVLLPIAGVPLAILCCQRISRDGLDLLLATSEESSDDLLVSEAEKYGINVFRGSLNNVLNRYVDAIEDLSDDDIVVRVTADNPVVDVEFINALIDEFTDKQCDYLGTHSPVDKLPYGLSAEVMTAGSLRLANRNAFSSYEKEHVTPWIRENLSALIVDGYKIADNRDLSFLRCTVDSFDDYIAIGEIFKNDAIDAQNSSWKQLIDLLMDSLSTAEFNIPFNNKKGAVESVIALGTVQLGLDYGIANKQGMPDADRATAIVRKAIQYGVSWIDTARGYGISEQRVGGALSGGWASRCRLVTKLDPLADLDDSTSSGCVEKAVENSVLASLHALQLGSLDVLLLHRWAHRHFQQGAVWNKLISFKNQRVIRELGASIYDPAEAIQALADKDVTHLQIPFNLLDHRWLNKDIQQALSERPDVRIHVRSAFLQGLLISDAAIWPSWFDDTSAKVEQIKQLVKQLKRKNRADLCLAFIRSFDWVDSVVVGVESEQQLLHNLELSCEKPLTVDERKLVVEALASSPERLINPSLW